MLSNFLFFGNGLPTCSQHTAWTIGNFYIEITQYYMSVTNGKRCWRSWKRSEKKKNGLWSEAKQVMRLIVLPQIHSHIFAFRENNKKRRKKHCRQAVYTEKYSSLKVKWLVEVKMKTSASENDASTEMNSCVHCEQEFVFFAILWLTLRQNNNLEKMK